MVLPHKPLSARIPIVMYQILTLAEVRREKAILYMYDQHAFMSHLFLQS